MSFKVGERLSVIFRWPGHISQSALALYALINRIFPVHSFFSLLLAVGIGLSFVGGSVPSSRQLRFEKVASVVAGRGFSLLHWEWRALNEKLESWRNGVGVGLSIDEERALVYSYFDRADEIRRQESLVNRLVSASSGGAENAELRQARTTLAEIRAAQDRQRPAVEAVIQRQVGEILTDAGLGVGGWPTPPVNFTFTEPPQILILSPRHEIRNIYAKMLEPDIDSAEADQKEKTIKEQTDLAAYITRIGGMAAYPTMVVNRGSISWIITVVAHEWVHNYLTLFPLGMRYGTSPEVTTLNETVADIIGDEVGRRVLVRYYPELAPPEVREATDTGKESTPPAEPEEPPPFDFQLEMRETRLRVDDLLAKGDYLAAEEYMESRRRIFVENGYFLRVLNQAYFAFHGSYATGGASSSPIGSQLQELQERKTPEDIAGFLQTVRWFTSAADLERVLEMTK